MILREDLLNLKQVIDYNKETKNLVSDIKKEAEEKINKLMLERNTKLYEVKEGELKSKIEGDAKQEFQETNNKSLLGGIGIRETTKYEYDKDVAFKWAKEHSLCLQLDDKAFSSLAKTQDFDFVVVNKGVQVTFPKEIKLEE